MFRALLLIAGWLLTACHSKGEFLRFVLTASFTLLGVRPRSKLLCCPVAVADASRMPATNIDALLDVYGGI